MTIMTMMIIDKLIKVVHVGFYRCPDFDLEQKIQFVGEKIG